MRTDRQGLSPLPALDAAGDIQRLDWSVNRPLFTIMTPPTSTLRPDAVLLATDLTARSDRALDRAVQLARHWDARLVVLVVLPAEASFSRSGSHATEDPEDIATPATPAQRLRAQAERDLAGVDIPVEIRVEQGAVGDAVQRVAAETGCGLIVTGLGRRDALGAIELGSSVLWLSRHATVPVLVVQDRVHGPYRGVAVASDLSPASATALQLADGWFGDIDRHELLHAFDVPLRTHVGSRPQRDAILHGLQADAEDAVHAFVRQTLDERRAGHWQLTAAPAHPVRLLRQHAMIRPGTLAVIASHGRSALADRLVGSVAKRLLETAACDMLVVRTGKA